MGALHSVWLHRHLPAQPGLVCDVLDSVGAPFMRMHGSHNFREVSFYNDFCPGQNQGEGNKGNNLFHMTGGPSDSKWCFKVRGSKSAFTISTQGVVDDDVEITLYSDEKCDKPFAENITFDGCIAGPREVRSKRADKPPEFPKHRARRVKHTYQAALREPY